MRSSQETSEEAFQIPARRKSHRGLIVFLIALLLCVGVLVAYEWEDISYVLPDSLKGQPSEQQVATEAEASAVPWYVYETLNEDDQKLYRLVYEALTEKSKVAFPTDNRNELRRIADCVQADHPELGDTAAAVMVEGGIFTPAYVAGVPLAEGNEEQLLAQIEAAANECAAGVAADADDYEKAKHAFEWLATRVSYGKDLEEEQDRIVINASGKSRFTLDEGSSTPREHGQTLYNALVEQKAVCAGYARAYQYLLQHMGIECTVVSGTAQGSLHAWCLAKLDGSYYFIDPTWGDPEYVGEQVGNQQKMGVDFRYFAVTSADLAPTHVPDDTFALPTCVATADNYYVREGLLFDKADAERLGTLMMQQFSQGLPLSIRCASLEVYEDLLHNWIETGEIGRLALVERYQYSPSDQGIYTITLWPVE